MNNAIFLKQPQKVVLLLFLLLFLLLLLFHLPLLHLLLLPEIDLKEVEDKRRGESVCDQRMKEGGESSWGRRERGKPCCIRVMNFFKMAASAF